MKTGLKTGLVSAFALTCSAFAPTAFADETLEIKDFIGTITWSNGPMSVDVKKNKGDTEIKSGASMIVDGGFNKIDRKACKSSYGSYDLDWFGKRKEGHFGGYENLKDYPMLDISVPKDTKVIIRNAVIFTEGTPDISEADLEFRHCGQVTLGDVDNTLALDSRGSADVTVGRTGQIVASLKGSGDLDGGDSGDVLISSHGSGDAELDDIGSLEGSFHGSGDFEASDVEGRVELSSHGSGDIDLVDVSGPVTFSGHGSGDLDVASVNGPILYLKSHGSGDIDVGGGEVDDLKITVRGSSTVEYSGEAKNADLRASGSGDIRVNRVSGVAEIKTSGSGDIDIDERG